MTTEAKSIEVRSITIRKLADDSPDLSWLEQDCFAESGYGPARLANYGETWGMVGIRADAEIVACGVVQTISSAGLWGVESDSSDEHFAEIASDELDALRDILTELGAVGAVAVRWIARNVAFV